MRKSVSVGGMLVIAGLVASAAQAHQWGCWIQADRNVKIRNAASGATQAIADWNNLTILNLSSVSSGEEVFVTAFNSGGTGWAEATITQSDGCTILRAVVQYNSYYSWTSNAKRGMYCQGLGHAFGLDHSNDGGCMGGGYWYDIGTHYTIVTHNINDIAAMYADRVANRTPEHPVVGPEADAPRIRAFWVNQPRSLREATRMAAHVVVATVTDVTDGDPIDSGAPGVSPIPTQRVHFTVQRSHKGDLSIGESFVLFQNGNEENRFDEDPSYRVGHRYMLMLTPREDGTYLVVSPEGRYEITRNGLVPAAKKGFAFDLKGAPLDDVTADIERASVEIQRQ